MLAMSLAGESGGLAAGGGFDLIRGAIAGGLIVAVAYLAGFSVFRRTTASVCALLMVASATAMMLAELGLIKAFNSGLLVFLQGLFGAAAIVFLSAVIRAAQDNKLLGGILFVASLGLVAIGILNVVTGVNFAPLMGNALFLVGAFAVALSLSQAMRDSSAQLVLPGALLALASPFAAGFFGGGEFGALASNGMFAFGVIAASLVALTQHRVSRIDNIGLHAHEAQTPAFAPGAYDDGHSDRSPRVSENQLAQVLDYSGVAVWDWSPVDAHQTDSLPTLMGADSRGIFTPEALRAFIHKDDLAKYEKRVLAPGEGDGSFDLPLKLHDGRVIRLRGARAVDEDGDIERLVAFIESETARPQSRRVAAAAPVGAIAAADARPDSKSMRAHAGRTADPLAKEVAAALKDGALSTAFQPIVSLSDGKIAGYEALVRWPGKAGAADRASPEAIVKAAEAAGEGGALARFILSAACDHLKTQAKTLGRKDLFVAMNLSVSQLQDDALTDDIRSALSKNGLKPKSLVIEVTETQAISDYAGAEARLRDLSAAGAALAFDDFGAGFSSLANLKNYAFDFLKIDKSFIDGIASGGEQQKIARAIAGLGADLGLTVIAEGVEDARTADAAREIGCTLAQGYEFGAPAKSADAKPDTKAGAKSGAVSSEKSSADRPASKDLEKAALTLSAAAALPAETEAKDEAAPAKKGGKKKSGRRMLLGSSLR